GQGTHRDQVDPGPGVAADGVEGDAAAHLEQRSAATPGGVVVGGLHAPADLVGAHVVEQQGVGARPERLADLLEAVALDVHGAAWPPQPGGADGVGDAEPGEVVVLEEDPVGQVAAVVGAAAGPHR